MPDDDDVLVTSDEGQYVASSVDDQVVEPLHHDHVDAALMLSFGSTIPGREAIAVELFTEVSRFLGRLLADEVIVSFRPYFYADGLAGDVSGFFLIEGGRDALDGLRRDEAFTQLVIKATAGVANVRLHTLLAGSAAGRRVNLFRDQRDQLGLL